MNWYQELDKQQVEAANELEGPVLILAGAGSGKTRTMTARICHLIESGVMPQNILAITFTNKAANEMKNRLIDMLGTRSLDALPTVCTFHKFGLRLIHDYKERLGYYNKLSIVTNEDEQSGIIKEIILARNPETNPDTKELNCKVSGVKNLISECKDNLITENEHDKMESLIKEEYDFDCDEFAAIYQEYERILKENCLLDYDDLIEKAVFLLRYDDIREWANNYYQYINVDEYQDTSSAQFELVRLLAGKKRNVCVVGDDYQSIYGFRNAKIENIINFPNYFKECKKFLLHANYRSTKNIVEGASHVISKNNKQIEKKLHAVRKENGKIEIVKCPTAADEGNFVAKNIKKLIREGGKYSEAVVLYRSRPFLSAIENAFIEEGIPYTLFGGVGFYNHEVIVNIVSYLKILAGHNYIGDLKRIANFPPRKLGEKALNKIISQIEKQRNAEEPLWETIDTVAQDPNANVNFQSFWFVMKNLQSQISTIGTKELVDKILALFEINKYYKDAVENADDKEKECVKKKEKCLELLDRFVEKASSFEEKYSPNNYDPGKTMLDAFLEEICLTDDEKNDSAETVSIMTIHKAKGLEWKYVFLIGQDKSIYSKKLDQLNEEEKRTLQEENRVIYVGMTRAKDKLCITYADKRYINGDWSDRLPIDCILEIPETNRKFYKSNSDRQVEFELLNDNSDLESILEASVNNYVEDEPLCPQKPAAEPFSPNWNADEWSSFLEDSVTNEDSIRDTINIISNSDTWALADKKETEDDKDDSSEQDSLSPLEWAYKIREYKDSIPKGRKYGNTRCRIAEHFNISEASVARHESILKFIPEVQELCKNHNCPYPVMQPLAAFTINEQKIFYEKILENEMQNKNISRSEIEIDKVVPTRSLVVSLIKEIKEKRQSSYPETVTVSDKDNESLNTELEVTENTDAIITLEEPRKIDWEENEMIMDNQNEIISENIEQLTEETENKEAGKAYTKQEDELILAKRSEGITNKEIGTELGRTAASIRRRYQHLLKKTSSHKKRVSVDISDSISAVDKEIAETEAKLLKLKNMKKDYEDKQLVEAFHNCEKSFEEIISFLTKS